MKLPENYDEKFGGYVRDEGQLGGRCAVVMFRKSGVGNVVSPLTSPTSTFCLPELIISTWRGQPGGPEDEPQHETMGRIISSLWELMDNAWELFPGDETDAVVATTGSTSRALYALNDRASQFYMVGSMGCFSSREETKE